MELKKNMQTNISLTAKDGKVQARLNYRDQDIPEPISVEASGEDLEEVITHLYDNMMDSIDKMLAEPEEEEIEELSDTEYIKKLEAQIDQLLKENKALQKKKETIDKSPWHYNTYKMINMPRSSSRIKDFENLWKEFF